jgi:hypothetical protein
MNRQLCIPLSQSHTLITGQATRILVHKSRGDDLSLHDTGWVCTDSDGYVRFAAGDHVVIGVPQVGHVCTVKVASIANTPQGVRAISNQVVRDYGYESLADLWQDYAYRYDHPAHKHWMFAKRKVNNHDRAEVFRSFLSTRDTNIWNAWILYVRLVSVNVAIQKGHAS